MALIHFLRHLYWLCKRAGHFRRGRSLLAHYRPSIEMCYGQGPLAFKPNLKGYGKSYVYFVFQGETCRGVLRILPTLKKTVDSEWAIYQKGGPLGLTPKNIWKSGDGCAMINSFLEDKRCIDYVKSGKLDVWEAVRMVWERIVEFHQAVGCSLGDASLFNTLLSPTFHRLTFVDFELANGNRPEDFLFDYPHVLEVMYKYMDETVKNRAKALLPKLIAGIPEEEKAHGCECFASRLPRVLSDPRFHALNVLCNPATKEKEP